MVHFERIIAVDFHKIILQILNIPVTNRKVEKKWNASQVMNIFNGKQLKFCSSFYTLLASFLGHKEVHSWISLFICSFICLLVWILHVHLVVCVRLLWWCEPHQFLCACVFSFISLLRSSSSQILSFFIVQLARQSNVVWAVPLEKGNGEESAL
jgi:hypothetical protein